jgi:hypothetical protein
MPDQNDIGFTEPVKSKMINALMHQPYTYKNMITQHSHKSGVSDHELVANPKLNRVRNFNATRSHFSEGLEASFT